MRELQMLEEVLAAGHVEASAFVLRPDDRAMLPGLDWIVPVPSDQASHAAADDLATCLTRLGPEVRVVHRLITAGITPVEGD